MAKLNDGIANIEPGSVLEDLYGRLENGLNEISQVQAPDFSGPEYVKPNPDGSVIVDEHKIELDNKEYCDINRKNAAFIFADSAVKSLGIGSEGGVKGSVSIKGDSMLGKLNALYGLAAGDNGVKIMEVYQTEEEDPTLRKSIVEIVGELHLNSRGLYINNNNVISFLDDTLSLDASSIALNGNVTCTDTLSIGNIVISSDDIKYKEHIFYHAGNSNLVDVDWTMGNATVDKNMLVRGGAEIQSSLLAQQGIEVNYDGFPVFKIQNSLMAEITGDLNFLSGGIKFDNVDVLYNKNKNVLSIAAPERILNLGDGGTLKVAIQSGLYDDDGEYELVSKFGDGLFPNSLTAGHGLGNTLLKTYKVSQENTGVILYKYLKFNNTGGPGFRSDDVSLIFDAPFTLNKNIEGEIVPSTTMVSSSLGYIESTSLYKPLNRDSSSLVFHTDGDFFVFDKAIEGEESIGIRNSKTRLLKDELFFNDNARWIVIRDGIKHYGNDYLTGSIGSVEFSSGYAGNGWRISKNKLTGNIGATFDELTVRKKTRLYELEVQKYTATNGSLWISDSCSGDIVEEII